MKAIQQYYFYQTKTWYGYETKESFDDGTHIVCDRVNKILSETEVEKIINMARQECRAKIIDVIDNK